MMELKYINIKETIYLIFAVMLTTNGYTQGLNKDQHTFETKVADVLLRLSVKNPVDEDKIYRDLAELGEGVIPLITSNLVISDVGGNGITRKAISGLIKTVAKSDNKTQKEDLSKALEKAIEEAKSEEARNFLKQELMHLKNGTTDYLQISSPGTGPSNRDYFVSLDSIRLKLQTGSQKNQDNRLLSLVAEIHESNHTSDQMVLLLREAMGLAKTQKQREAILLECSKENTLLSLIFISKFFDCPELKQTAADAAYKVILGNSELFGPDIIEIANVILESKDILVSKSKRDMLRRHLDSLPKENGYTSIFNGKDLTGWKGLVGNPITRKGMNSDTLRLKQKKANEQMLKDWKVKDGILYYNGEGYDNICSDKKYKDFELILDWRIEPFADGGVYLRGSPQVQIWDPANPKKKFGEDTGSGALHNNEHGANRPLFVADNPIKEWNTFRITMIGERVTVYLNGQLVVDDQVMENYWNRSLPIFDKEAIELQAHETRVEFRDIFIREIPPAKPYTISQQEKKNGFAPILNGVNLDGWIGNTTDFFTRDGMLVCKPTGYSKGNLFTKKEYSDFILRFEFKLEHGTNNGLGIRMPMINEKVAYEGIELQVLDNTAEIYKNLNPYQYHGSVYGVIPAKRGFLKPVGEWNFQEVQAIGERIKITLNGEVILDGDIAKASNSGSQTVDHRNHPGLLSKKGHLGFLGHGTPVYYRNIRIKDLSR